MLPGQPLKKAPRGSSKFRPVVGARQARHCCSSHSVPLHMFLHSSRAPRACRPLPQRELIDFHRTSLSSACRALHSTI